jgi:hypothetical protein
MNVQLIQMKIFLFILTIFWCYHVQSQIIQPEQSAFDFFAKNIIHKWNDKLLFRFSGVVEIESTQFLTTDCFKEKRIYDSLFLMARRKVPVDTISNRLRIDVTKYHKFFTNQRLKNGRRVQIFRSVKVDSLSYVRIQVESTTARLSYMFEINSTGKINRYCSEGYIF